MAKQCGVIWYYIIPSLPTLGIDSSFPKELPYIWLVIALLSSKMYANVTCCKLLEVYPTS